jgi:general secretion pathway protein M
MATQSMIKDHIAYMKPSSVTGEGMFRQVMVEMKVQTLGLKQLVAFLEHIESPENVVAVKRISIQENKKVKGTLDVIIQVISIDRQGGK